MSHTETGKLLHMNNRQGKPVSCSLQDWVTRLGQSYLLLEDLPCAELFGEQRLKDQRIAGNVGVYTVPKILLLNPPSTRVPATALTMCLHQFAVLMAKSMWEYCHFLEYFFISFRLDVK